MLVTSLFTSLFSFVVARDFLKDPLLLLFSLLLAGVGLDWSTLCGVGYSKSSRTVLAVKIGGDVQVIGLELSCAPGILSSAFKIWYSCDEKFT